jgi:uncharacterized protein YciI
MVRKFYMGGVSDMGLFIAIGFDDEPKSKQRRDDYRAAHRAYVRSNDAKIRLVGPFLDADGGQCASMYIFEADSPEEIRAWFAEEPFYKGGVYKELVIRSFIVGKNELPQQGWPG